MLIAVKSEWPVNQLKASYFWFLIHDYIDKRYEDFIVYSQSERSFAL